MIIIIIVTIIIIIIIIVVAVVAHDLRRVWGNEQLLKRRLKANPQLKQLPLFTDDMLCVDEIIKRQQ